MEARHRNCVNWFECKGTGKCRLKVMMAEQLAQDDKVQALVETLNRLKMQVLVQGNNFEIIKKEG